LADGHIHRVFHIPSHLSYASKLKGDTVAPASPECLPDLLASVHDVGPEISHQGWTAN